MILRSDRALVLGRLGRFAEAIELAQASLRERRERAERTPELAEPARDALVPLHALADLYWRQGDKRPPARRRAAIAGWERYAKRWPLSELDRKQSEEKRIEAEQRCRARERRSAGTAQRIVQPGAQRHWRFTVALERPSSSAICSSVRPAK